MLFQKITMFLLLCPLLAMLMIGYAIFYSRTDSTGLGTTYLTLFLLALIVAFALDRLAVRFVSAGWVSGFEAVLLLVGFLTYIYSSQTTTVDLSANRSPYVVLIWVKNPALSDPLQRTSLITKTLAVPDGQVLRLDYAEFDRHTITPPTAWGNGYFSTGIDLNDLRYVSAYIYAPEDHPYSKEELIQLIHKAVDHQTP